MRFEIYDADSEANELISENYEGMFLIYDNKHEYTICNAHGFIGFNSEEEAQKYIDSELS